MRRRHRALAEAALLAVVGVLLLSWLHDRAPAADLSPAFDAATLPAAATCTEEVPVGAVPRLSSATAVECPERFDGERVNVIGEVVGDVLRRDGGAWVQLNDDPYALQVGPLPVTGEQGGTNSGIAVWLPAPLDEDLVAGRSDHRGTVLEVEGTFLRTDPRDGGGTSVRAAAREVLEQGRRINVPVDPWSVVLGLVALVMAALLWRPLRP